MRVYSLLLFVLTIRRIIPEQIVVHGILILVGVIIIFFRLVYGNQFIVLKFLLLVAEVGIILAAVAFQHRPKLRIAVIDVLRHLHLSAVVSENLHVKSEGLHLL